jgi:hypothetical protein
MINSLNETILFMEYNGSSIEEISDEAEKLT